MTVYTCETCRKRVNPGDGYIFFRKAWHVSHRDCAGDLTDSYCLAIPDHFSDLLNAHMQYARHMKVPASPVTSGVYGPVGKANDQR